MKINKGERKDLKKEDYFFSVTDLTGKIIYANELFCNFAEYKYEEMEGQPHNMVRHEDMPKLIFHLLWDFLKNDRPIVAYVKNKTKLGNYYWVCATATPIKDFHSNKNSYLSVRIKPESKYFEIIPALYEQLVQIEKEHGSDWYEPCIEHLNKTLKSLNYNNYEEFMSDVIKEELELKEGCLNKTVNQKRDTNPLLSKYITNLNNIINSSTEILNLASRIIESMQEIDKLSKDSIYIFGDITLSSLNSDVSAIKLKEKGRSINSITSYIREFSESANVSLNSMIEYSNKLKEEITVKQSVYVSTIFSYFIALLSKDDVIEYLEQKHSLFYSTDVFKKVAVHTVEFENFLIFSNKIAKLIEETQKTAHSVKMLSIQGKIEGHNIENKGFINIMENLSKITNDIENINETLSDNCEMIIDTTNLMETKSNIFVKNVLASSFSFLAFVHSIDSNPLVEATNTYIKTDLNNVLNKYANRTSLDILDKLSLKYEQYTQSLEDEELDTEKLRTECHDLFLELSESFSL